MRIKLIDGKQKELILTAKGNLTWRELSKKVDINKEYLSGDVKRGRVLLKEDAYIMLCQLANKNFDEFIIEKLDDNWERSKGEVISKGTTIVDIKIPPQNQKLSELIGIILGDGSIEFRKAYKIGVYQVNIAGDKNLDKEYHLNYVSFLIKDLFGLKVKERLPKDKNGRYLIISSKKLVNFLLENELKAGNKIKNQVTIPSWIKLNPSYLSACIRGLFDTDGGIYKLNNQNTYQICFTSHNKTLLNDVRQGLLSLSINVSNIMNNRRIAITKKSELRKFLNQVGFQNPRHLNKIKFWNLDQVAP